jgi:hypothetical protein
MCPILLGGVTMLSKRMLLLVLISFLLVGCAPSKMVLKNIDTTSVKPMGLFVCSSTQIVDNRDVVHRNFVIDFASNTLLELLDEKYNLRLLNGIIPYDKAFKKYFGSFYIDEKLIADYAKQEGCNSCLIVYYATTNMNFLMAGPVLITYIERLPKDNENMNLYSRCSLYGWLVSSSNAKILAKSHVVLKNFNTYVQNSSDNQQIGDKYRSFIKGITEEMFTTLLK